VPEAIRTNIHEAAKVSKGWKIEKVKNCDNLTDGIVSIYCVIPPPQPYHTTVQRLS